MTNWRNSQRKRKEWTLKIGGVKLFELSVILLVIIWCIFMTGVQRGIWAERNRWQDRQEIQADILFIRFLEEIIQRESSGKHDEIWGDEGKSYGIAQFQESTFYWLAEKAGLQDPDWKDEGQQIALLAWAVKNGYGGLWTSVLQIEKEVENFLKNE